MSVSKRPTGETIVPAVESRYDWLLALLPFPMLLGILVAAVTDIRVAFGVSLGGLPSVAMLVYGLFVDPPLSGSSACQ
ncbi:hypothetical protein G3I44_17235 [Halogeometricum borinquense]|uniref:Uncharacterized protein n=1 Tax=Halogeometricum borinquense TaxID=60847 RepID=A0A6C0UKU5_9EURY|nr:hypothetical protein [Halogeometricum borinquense]QIB75867.1 hypothetical protein G3I44_17235 [Halogeometricum borinquense]